MEQPVIPLWGNAGMASSEFSILDEQDRAGKQYFLRNKLLSVGGEFSNIDSIVSIVVFKYIDPYIIHRSSNPS